MLVGIAMMVLTAGACGGANRPKHATSAPTFLSPAGHSYLSTAVAGHKLADGTRITLTFDAKDGLTVNAGCNTIGGKYRLDGTSLVTDQLSMTEMGCDAPREAQDRWVSQLLSARPTLTLNGTTLRLAAGSTAVTLVDRTIAEPDKPLVGPTWIVDTILEADVASSVPAGTTATVRFPTPTSIEVFDGCNHSTGTVVIRGGVFTVSDLLSPTAAKCTSPPAIAITGVFTPSVSFSISGNRLTLIGAHTEGLGLHAQG